MALNFVTISQYSDDKNERAYYKSMQQMSASEYLSGIVETFNEDGTDSKEYNLFKSIGTDTGKREALRNFLDICERARLENDKWEW